MFHFGIDVNSALMRTHTKTHRIVLKETGSILWVLGFIFIIPAIVSLIYMEWYSAAGFILSSVMSMSVGQLLKYLFRSAEEPMFNNALLIVSFGWLAATIMGGLPFYIISMITPQKELSELVPAGASYSSSLLYFHNPLHCIFESMSAYTTTGLTMVVHEPSVGKGILFYRSFAQWIGGAGFIILALSVLKVGSGRSSILMYRSEATGVKLKPKIIETTRGIWKAYAIITFFSAVYLVIGTRLILPHYPFTNNIFDSINHAMTGQSTGGFSTLDDSIASYGSPEMDILYLLPMALGSFSLPFYYRVIFLHRFSEFWKDIQTRGLIICYITGSIILSLLLWYADLVPNPVREGIFQFVSAMSTTGWQTSNISIWNTPSVVFIVFAGMFIGGASGATVGGIKMIRALIIRKGIQWRIKKAFVSQNAVQTIKFDGRVMLPDEMNSEVSNAAVLALLFLAIMLAGAFVTWFFMPEGYSFADALFESTSAQSTVGLSTGITGPSMHPAIEVTYIFQMWAGRLEIIPVLALFRAFIIGTGYKRNHNKHLMNKPAALVFLD
jgi:trk system potassium uptake protein TrkH